jgi:protein phosphatase
LPLSKRKLLFGGSFMKLRYSAHTDVGKTRDHNEDNYGVGEGEQVERLGELFVVCDGMGGHATGEIASRIGVETILSIYYGDETEDRPTALAEAFEQANARIYATGHGNMGTTGVAALLHHDALHIANVGDSRAYLVRDDSIRQVSRDHSFVNDQVAAGLITAEQARSSPHRNVITRALGYQPDVTVDLFRLPLQVGDTILLCSDGLHGLVSDSEIAAIAMSTSPPDEAVSRLVDLANQGGGTDNITVVLARVDALDWDSEPVTEEAAPDQEGATVELSAPAAGMDTPVGVSAAPPMPAPAPAGPAPSVERRLTLLGGLLATLLLTILVFVVLFTLNQPAADSATPGPRPTSQLTPVGSPAPAIVTVGPLETSTVVPTSSPAPNLTPTSAGGGAVFAVHRPRAMPWP